MKSALLVVILHAIGYGMTWTPFPFCTDSHKVDSIQTLVWIDAAMKPELAPYLGNTKLRYHPGTCFLSGSVFKPSYLDTSFIVEFNLSEDRRRQDYRWIPGGVHGTLWFSATGELDSTLDITESQVEGQAPILGSHREIRRRTEQYLVITHSYRRDENPWEVFDWDSVIVSDSVTTIHSILDFETSYTTRCVTEGSDYICTPTLMEGPSGDLRKQVWHLTDNRPDSLHTYFLDGRLESTEYWFWSPRIQSSLRQPYPRLRIPPPGKYREYNILGRMPPKR